MTNKKWKERQAKELRKTIKGLNFIDSLKLVKLIESKAFLTTVDFLENLGFTCKTVVTGECLEDDSPIGFIKITKGTNESKLEFDCCGLQFP